MTEESKKNQTPEQSAWQLAGRLWRDYLRHHLGRIAAATLFMILAAAATGAQAWMVQPALDELLVEGKEKLLWILPVAFVGIVLVKGLSTYGQAVLMQGLALHYYTNYRKSATDFDEGDWFAVMKEAVYMDELITRHSAVMDQHDPAREVSLVVDEWGAWYNAEPGTNPRFLYQQNSMRDALVAALHLHIFNAHNDRVRMANIAQTINVLQSVILTDEEKMILTPTYHVFEMFKVHQDAQRLSIDLKGADYTYGDQVIPGVSASASRKSAGPVHLTLCNTNPNDPVELVCELRGLNASSIAGRILTADTMTAHNTFDEPDRVAPRSYAGAKLSDEALDVVLPAMSVVVLELC